MWLQKSLAILVLMIAVTGLEVRAQETESDFFVSFDGEASLSIALDRVGILPARDVSDDEIEAFADEEGFEILRRLRGRIFILAVEQRSRAELVAFARNFRRTESIVGQAGLVATPEGAETPQILTDQFVAGFEAGVTREEIESFNADRGVEILLEDPGEGENVFLLTVTEESNRDALDMANLYDEENLTTFSEPNFVVVHEQRRAVPGGARFPKQTIPNDPFFGDQWHHRNTGQNGGTSDADLDTPHAWDVTMGDPGTVIAVIDGGFDVDGSNPHPDLTPNLWQNPGETAGTGSDDDGNGYADDVNGWDFAACRPDDDRDGQVDEDPVDGTDNDGDGQVDEDPRTPRTCGDNTLAGGSHGTSTAGAVAAEADNNQGVAGTCPDCRVMLIRHGGRRLAGTIFSDRLAFRYALREGADLVSNSWGYPVGTPRTRTLTTVINLTAKVGRPVLFAMTNAPYTEDCTGSTPDISSLQKVFAISASNNLGTRSPSGYGDCMEMVAPTFESTSPVGTLGATTTDVQGAGGYNTGSSSCTTSSGSVSDLSNNDYTRCFGGTSFATPSTAGVAGLILSADPSLDRKEVERLLQDTGNKIQDSMADYDDAGFSDPNNPPSGGLPTASTHGWGRVNAAEAVRVADQGVDVFVRDNRLDWGNTEQPSSTLFESPRQFIPWWQSVDVKVDGPPYQLSSPADASDFASLKNEDPIAGLKNRVYVRVRNRGPSAANDVKVTLRYGFAGTGLPRWPTGWGSSQEIGNKTISTVPYSGSSVAGGTNDPAKVVEFTWTAPTPKAGQPSPNHFCLLTELSGVSNDPSSTQPGPISNFVPTENNFSLDNLSVVNVTASIPEYTERFYVANPYDQPIDAEVTLDVPEGWDMAVENVPAGEPIALEEGERRLAVLRVYPPTSVLNGEETGTVKVRQEALFGEEERVVLGGLTYRYRQGDGLVAGSGLTIPDDGVYDFENPHMDILFSGVSNTGSVVVRRFNEGPSDESGIAEENVSDYRFRIDTPETEEGLLDFETAEVRFDVSRLAGIDNPESVKIYARPEEGTGSFSPLSTEYDETEGTLNATVSSFSEFAFASDTDPLPVEIVSFEAATIGEGAVELAWQTASEQNNAGFDVQHRPSEQEDWQEAGFIESKAPGGNTTETTSYRYVLKDLPVGTHQFRLRQVDKDGTTHSYDPASVRVQMQEALRLSGPAPNPVSERATLTFAVKTETEAKVTLYDLLGQEVRVLYRDRPTPGQSQRIRLDVSDLPSGTYILRLQAGDRSKTRRMTVVR